MDQKIISVLGCGWLGEPLARHLVSLGYKVKGSTTHQEKLSSLKHSGIEPFLVEVIPPLKGPNITEFFNSDVLFLNIPFKRSLSDPSIYQKQIEAVIKEVFHVPFIIFASSTSVYPDNIGEAREDTVFKPDNPRSRILADIEQFLLSHKRFQATVLRFAGLVGGERKISQKNPDRLVNLVHLEDCVKVVSQIISQNIRNEIFNVCADKQLGVAQSEKTKIVRNEKLKKRLNYKFVYPDPMSWV